MFLVRLERQLYADNLKCTTTDDTHLLAAARFTLTVVSGPWCKRLPLESVSLLVRLRPLVDV